MKRDFYSKAFDDATLIKLEIFKRYIREWLPVFMTHSRTGSLYERVNVYDFFAGPGRDKDKNPGSPLIIQNEVKAFCKTREHLKTETPIRMVFNDIEPDYIDLLEDVVQNTRCHKDCCSFEYSSKPFSIALQIHLSDMRENKQANLVIMDQTGMKEVTPEIVREILEAGTTDILFFISTGFIRRFAETSEFKGKLKVNSNQIKTVAYNTIHRFLCDKFSSRLTDEKAMLAPFSIKKGPNIHGIIFGTTHDLGMEKFLKVCWSLDSVTGEANYNIDNEVTWNGQQSLFPGDNKPTKTTVFETELLKFIETKKPNNKEVFRFGLKNGFYSSKCNDALRVLQEAEKFIVQDIFTMQKVRKSAFYLMDKMEKVRFIGV